ncbi:DUF2726 domain-containing protein [Sinimarinibacterium flocculans]|uniref:Uncharacterized protein DUF2726 n=1 Tax=Sinimarinibacterium flocculans TaxID=985250 RepID=A0A318EFE4_9GAMM|nr:DUF2726 domain-containing protein [Sinimarinibacterium flocculans]PXV69436.1 uncharacterized protein DUF2726 [Sinimarinibacterium flocculans]
MWLAAIVFVFAIAALLLAIRLLRQLPDDTAPAERYRSRGPLLSAAERSFFGVLQQAADDDKLVFAKVRVADVLSPERGLRGGKWQRAFNRISAKHFDFLLCDAAEVSPMIAIELDDASHAGDKARARDAFVDAACASAGLPVLRIPAQEAYSVQDLAAQIAERLRPPEATLPKSVPTGRSQRIEPRL